MGGSTDAHHRADPDRHAWREGVRLARRVGGVPRRPPRRHAWTACGSRFRPSAAAASLSVTHDEAARVLALTLRLDRTRRSARATRRTTSSASAPRRARSKWSKVNRGQGRGADRVRRDAAGRAGRGRAREGRRPVGRRLRSPAACRSCRTTSPPSWRRGPPRPRFFASRSTCRNRYAILHRLQDASGPETRARRLAINSWRMLEGRRAHPILERRC